MAMSDKLNCIFPTELGDDIKILRQGLCRKAHHQLIEVEGLLKGGGGGIDG